MSESKQGPCFLRRTVRTADHVCKPRQSLQAEEPGAWREVGEGRLFRAASGGRGICKEHLDSSNNLGAWALSGRGENELGSWGVTDSISGFEYL